MHIGMAGRRFVEWLHNFKGGGYSFCKAAGLAGHMTTQEMSYILVRIACLIKWWAVGQ